MKPNSIPYVHTGSPSRKTITVFWQRLTPTGNHSRDFHVVNLHRYRADVNLAHDDRGKITGRRFETTVHASITTEQAAICAALLKFPLPKLRTGSWTEPRVLGFSPNDHPLPGQFYSDLSCDL